MQIEIRGQHIELDESVKSHIERRVVFAIGRFQSRLRRVTVRVADINGPRGGVDKRCRIAVELAPSGSLVVEDVDSELFSVIDRATDRLGRAVEREVGRQQEFGREGMRQYSDKRSTVTHD